MIEVRKLAAVDMAWLGARLVVAEYALGVSLPAVLGLLSIRAGLFGPVHSDWEAASGIWLETIAVNYVALLIYAVLLIRAGTVKKEGQPELAHARRYGVQQIMILIPLSVAVLAIIEESRRQKESNKKSRS